MYNMPYGNNPVNIYQTPYSPQNEELQKLMVEFQEKYKQVLQGNYPTNSMTTPMMEQSSHVEYTQTVQTPQKDPQKLILDYLSDVHGISQQQFQWEFEEYCKVMEEKEKMEEESIKNKVRERLLDGGQPVTSTVEAPKEVKSEVKTENSPPPPPVIKPQTQNKGGK